MLKRIVPIGVVAGLVGLAAFAQHLAAFAPEHDATQPAEQKTVTKSGLTIYDDGYDQMTVQPGDRVTVHYTLKLENGNMVDSSIPRNEPFSFTLGTDPVIKGWAEGVTGMKCGQKRRLVVPPELGYGAVGAPPTIPGNATLYFDLQVLYISRSPRAAPPAAEN